MSGQTNSMKNEYNQKESEWLYLSDEAENEAANQLDEILEVTYAEEIDHIESKANQFDYLESQREESSDRIDFSPVDSNLNFDQRKAELNELFNGYVSSLVNKIEEQASIIAEKNIELEEKDIQLKLIPDLQKQLQSKEEETKLEHFEAQALKKQVELLKADKETTEKVARISRTILNEVERDAIERSLEIESSKETKQHLAKLQEEIATLRKPWWQKLF